MEKLAYSVCETADLLGISKTHAYQLVKEGVLPVLELGKRKVIPKELLNNWIKETINTYKKPLV
ncbi:excisionase family DNA binding protein [Lachnospiraceae bacterium PF1-22]|uniref:helix-turn-helix domain-containing protein n=1 Tax=Ohessyouella blattaphilus TaxID=2949333 RepID=UPI003E2C82C9